jgi:hypothetical protein
MTMMNSMSQVLEKEMVRLAHDATVEEEGMEVDAVEEEVDKVAEAAEETTSKNVQLLVVVVMLRTNIAPHPNMPSWIQNKGPSSSLFAPLVKTRRTPNQGFGQVLKKQVALTETDQGGGDENVQDSGDTNWNHPALKKTKKDCDWLQVLAFVTDWTVTPAGLQMEDKSEHPADFADSHADTCVAERNTRIMHLLDKKVNVTRFDPSQGKVTETAHLCFYFYIVITSNHWGEECSILHVDVRVTP